MKFLYVFNKQDKTNLINKGYKLLKDDAQNDVFIFAADKLGEEEIVQFDTLEKYALSDVLTF